MLVIDHVLSCYSLPLSSLHLGMHCTCHRVFLATLIVAAKYLNDQSPKNKHWSAHSQIFSVGEVNLMEKQLLSLLVSTLSLSCLFRVASFVCSMTAPWENTGDIAFIPCHTMRYHTTQPTSACPTAAAITIVRSSRIEFWKRRKKVVGTKPNRQSSPKQRKTCHVPMSCSPSLCSAR